jgi:hypothetical protein
VKPSDWIRETKSYFLAEEATSWTGMELVRFKDFLVNAAGKNSIETAGIILQDGGELRDHTLSDLPDELWKDFQSNFLNKTD